MGKWTQGVTERVEEGRQTQTEIETGQVTMAATGSQRKKEKEKR